MSGREWTEYDVCGAGYQPAEPYGDFTVALDGSNDPVVTNVTHYIGGGAAAGSVGGLGTVAQQTVSGGATTNKHGDLMGSVQLSTDGSGAADSSPATLAYTAFGEHVTAGSGSSARIGFPVTTGSIGATRYHYAGAHGYESGLLSLSGPNATLAPITLQHVGARWYQPGIGRFIQRDPIGLAGGLNEYSYVNSSSLVGIDPDGTSSLLRADVVVALIETDIAQSGVATVNWGGNVFRITNVITNTTGGRTVATLIGTNAAGQPIQKEIPFMAKACLEVIRSPSGGIMVTPQSGGCGATGLEAAPLMLWMTLRRRQARTVQSLISRIARGAHSLFGRHKSLMTPPEPIDELDPRWLLTVGLDHARLIASKDAHVLIESTSFPDWLVPSVRSHPRFNALRCFNEACAYVSSADLPVKVVAARVTYYVTLDSHSRLVICIDATRPSE